MIAAALVLLLWGPAAARPSPALPDGFRETFVPGFLFVHRPEDARSARRLAEFAHGVRARMKRELGLRDPALVRVYLAADRQDYRDLQPDRRSRPEWSAGVAFPARRVIVTYSPRGANRAGVRNEVRQVLTHELAHVYLYDALGPDVEIPHWLQEGYARLRAGEGQLALAWDLTWGWLLGDLIPLEELIHRFPRKAGRARLAYAESLSFVAYLLGEYGPGTFPSLLAWVRSGKTVDEALEIVTRKPFAELEQDWISWLALHWTFLRILTDRSMLWVFAAVLIVLAWWKVRLRQKRRLAEMEAEEALAYGRPPPEGRGN